MLFRSRRRQYQFYLYKLSDVERTEISNLITKNGGEVCANDKFPAIRLSNCEIQDGENPVFHINYIRQCVERNQLLDLINFKIGAQGYYGCLMSILVHGENICSYDKNTYSHCSSPQIKSSPEYHHPVIEDHTSGQGDSNVVQENDAENSFTIKNECSPPDTPLQDSQFIPLRYLSDSKFLVEEARQDSQLISFEWPKDLKFSPKKSPQNSERLPSASPEDTEFFPEESQSPMRTIVIKRIRERFPETGQIEFASQIPQPVKFDELNYDLDILRTDQSLSKGITLLQNSCLTVSESMTNVDTPLERTNDGERDIKVALPCINVNVSYPQIAVKEETQVRDNVPISVTRDNEISLNGRLERLQMNKLETPNYAKPRRSIRKLFSENIDVDKQPGSGGWKTWSNPTILRDEHNQVKILGENKQFCNIVKRHGLTSNIDNTDHDPTAAIFDCDKRRFVDRNSSFVIKGDDSKNEVLGKRADDGEVAEASNNDRRTIQQSESKRKSKSNSHTSTIPVNTSRVKNENRNTALTSIIDSDSYSSSEVEAASTASLNRNLRKASCARKITRNFSTWEQQEMINYLIEKRKISEGRGNAVWKQMIDDGYLTHRTPYSLNNHFRRIILPTIHRFKLKHKHLSEFQNLVKQKLEFKKEAK